jgi:hypothetical protein
MNRTQIAEFREWREHEMVLEQVGSEHREGPDFPENLQSKEHSPEEDWVEHVTTRNQHDFAVHY